MRRALSRLLPIGRSLARRMPRLANSALGRAARAAVRELVYPTSAVAWRRSLPDSATTTSDEPRSSTPSTSRIRLPNPNALAKLTSPFIETVSGSTCDLVLCCAFTGRHHILDKIVEESLADATHEVRWMLCGSTPEDEEFIRALAAKTRKVAGFTCKNLPLGRKWQTCVHRAHSHFDASLFGIVGSDDFVSKKLIRSIVDRHVRNLQLSEVAAFMPAMYCALEWLVCHVDPKANLPPNIIKCSYEFNTAFQPLGAGRFYTQEFLNSCNGLIFDSTLDRLLDDRGFKEVIDRGKSVEYYSIEDGPLVSVKGEWKQLNSFKGFLEAKTLILEEYTFTGYAVLREALMPLSLNYLMKPSAFDPQFHFAEVQTGLKLVEA